MYKVSSDMFPELQRRVKAITKKLDKYGLMYEFKVFDTVVEKVNVYRLDSMSSTRVKVGERVVEVVPYTFWMEELKIGDWKPVAIIEHNALTIDGTVRNMVKAIGDADILDSWWTAASLCDHCGSARKRSKTIMLQNRNGENSGTYYQVGSTCVKDFTGIDANDVISLYASIDDIYLEEAYETSVSSHVNPSGYVETVNFLAFAIQSIEKDGYVKYGTKTDAFSNARSGRPSDEYIIKSKEIISFFETLDIDVIPSYEQLFYSNIKGEISKEYTNCNGLIAYCPVAYQKVQTILTESVQKLADAKISKWQGEVGAKISVEVTYERRIGYDTQWGYCYIHLFKDADGNIYKWSTGSSLEDRKVDGILTGTIKAHDDYDGIKQTAVTRCKIT